MTTATTFLGTVTQVQSDIGDVSEFSSDLGTTLDYAMDTLEVPGDLEDMLREPADAVDLPDAAVAVLGLLPFGIGTAIKTIDKIGDATADVIDEQADIMGALDGAWATPRKVVETTQDVNSVLAGTASAAGFVNAQMQEEATRLAVSLGNQEIQEGFELANRMASYEEAANAWFDARDDLLAPLRVANAALDKAIADIASILPDTTLFEDAWDAILAVMQPISDAAQELEDAICVVITVTPEIVIPGTPEIVLTPAIPPIMATDPFSGNQFVLIPGIPAVVIPAIPPTVIPAVVVDVCDILTGAQSGFDAIVETVLNEALALIGVDFAAVAESLQDELLAPLQPVFDAIEQLQAEAAKVIAELTDVLEPLAADMQELIDALDEATTIASLFENTIEGDDADSPQNMADVLIGTDGEDAIFGLNGNDDITGGGGDFLFGGRGRDVLTSGGEDEIYGGAGRDTLNGSDLTDRMDGGKGADALFGGAGDDLLAGGAGNDRLEGGGGLDELRGGDGDDVMIGHKGDDWLSGEAGDDLMIGGGGSDVFVFQSGNDTILDFSDDLDKLLIDGAVVGVNSTTEALELATVVDENVTFDFGEAGSLTVRGVSDVAALADDLVLM